MDIYNKLDPAGTWGALVRYLLIAIGAVTGVTSEALLLEIGGFLVAVITGVIGIIKTYKAEKLAASTRPFNR